MHKVLMNAVRRKTDSRQSENTKQQTMAASYTILPVQLDDLPALADLVHTSKLALPVNQLLFRNWPNDAAQKPLYTQAVVSSHNDPTVRDLKAVDTISGKIAGYIAFSRKHPTAASASIPDTDSAKDDTQQPQQQSSTPEGLNPDVLAAIAGLGAETARHFDSLARYGTAPALPSPLLPPLLTNNPHLVPPYRSTH